MLEWKKRFVKQSKMCMKGRRHREIERKYTASNIISDFDNKKKKKKMIFSLYLFNDFLLTGEGNVFQLRFFYFTKAILITISIFTSIVNVLCRFIFFFFYSQDLCISSLQQQQRRMK